MAIPSEATSSAASRAEGAEEVKGSVSSELPDTAAAADGLNQPKSSGGSKDGNSTSSGSASGQNPLPSSSGDTSSQGAASGRLLPELVEAASDDDSDGEQKRGKELKPAAPAAAVGQGEVSTGEGSSGGAEESRPEASDGSGMPQVVVEEPPKQGKGTWAAIFWSFFLLGFTSFGGPTANVARFHKSFVELRGWMSEDIFVELLALCQAIPGPGASQMSFAIGVFQKGLFGGLLSGFLFQMPGFVVMTLAGFGAAKFLVDPAEWLSACSAGLAAVAISLVAEAAIMLGIKLCYDWILQSICIACAVVTFYYQSQWIFPTLIVLGGLVTIITERNKPIPPPRGEIEKFGLTWVGGVAVLLFWVATLVGSTLWKNATSYEEAKWIHWFQPFYLTGSVTYGGGQVVLPLLENTVVSYENYCPPDGGPCYKTETADTLVTSQQFFAGLALAQALPGPLFNLSAYLGAILGGAAGVVACTLGLFGPGIIIIFGILPFWGKFRKWTVYKRALPGVNAAAIGLIYASVFSMSLKAYAISPFPVASVCIGMIGFWATSFIKMPAPLAVIGGGTLGVIAWATDMH